MMPNGPRLVRICVAGAVWACCGCATRMGWTPAGYGDRLHEDIHRILGQQEAAWNDGNLEGFMQAYWRSPDLTFSSGGRVLKGWKATLEHYRRRYPDRNAMGRLHLGELEIIPLGPDAALVLGRWRLELDQPIGGAFTLVWRRTDGRWVIIHDHTSVDAT